MTLQDIKGESALHSWAEKIQQDIYYTPHIQPLPLHIFEIGAKQMSFSPICSCMSEEQIGWNSIPVFPYKKGAVESHKRDFCSLVGCYIRALQQAHGQDNTLVRCTVNINLFKDESLAELYTALLKRLHSETRKIITLEIKGLGQNHKAPKVRERLEEISPYIGAYWIESSLLSPFEHEDPPQKTFAYGFNMKEINMDVDSKKNLAKKFVEQYKGYKTYTTNVETDEELSMLKDIGINHVSGPACK